MNAPDVQAIVDTCNVALDSDHVSPVASPARTAFVFAGGGSLGAVHVGMLKALTRHGLRPDFVVGASVGAINATYFAFEPSLPGVLRLERIWERLSRKDVFPFSLTNSLLSLVGKRDYFVTPAGLQSLIEAELPNRRLEDTVIPCHVIATDLLSGTETAFTSGAVLPALVASAAIPALFPPVQLHGRYLVDGGVASNTPISAAIRLGATRIIVLPTGMSCAIDAPPHGAVAIALHAVNLLVMQQLVNDMDRLRHGAQLIVVPPLCPLTTTPYDFSHSGELIRRAAASTRLWLKKGGLGRPNLSPALLVHHHCQGMPARVSARDSDHLQLPLHK